jgi:transcriptional regulator with XRE-family HTH domain
VIGDQIRQARLNRGLSQAQAAKLAGVQRKQLSNLENDKGVSLPTLSRVVTALEIEVLALGPVQIVPGVVDAERVLGAAESAVSILQNLIVLLRAATGANARQQIPIDTNAVLAAAAVPRPRLSADDPVLRQLQELVDRLAAEKAEARIP